ncbi:MAG TPA: bile acid:sodium symporter [Opitutales bacterium]|nr:bile acid:sodium symporter [Opitutales bacterium]
MIVWLRKQSFVLLLVAAVLIALVWPEPANVGGGAYATRLADLAVALIFFLQGLSLPTRRMMAGRRPLRLHAFVLAWNFILFPLSAGLLSAAVSFALGRELSMGLWMLAILPTTIASATAFTAASQGEVPQAIFASIFSNLLGILLVPLLALAYLSASNEAELSLLPVFTKLCWIILMPLLVGQCFRRCFRESSIFLSERLRWLPQAAILYIVYLAFAKNVSSGLLDSLEPGRLFWTLCAVVFLLLLVSWGVWQSAGWIKLSQQARVAAFFTASQKSIATGLPLLTTVFGAASLQLDSGLVLVPLLLYHSLQLLLGGILIPRFAAASSAAPSARS